MAVIFVDKTACGLFAYCEFLRKLVSLAAEFLDVDVFKGEYSHALYEAIGAVDVPDPNILHVELEIKVGWGVNAV